MKIISHRGFWNDNIKPNSIEAFTNSFKNNFGIEFDVRDLDGSIVISHDIPLKSNNIILLSELLKLYKSFKNNLTLAINIKSDGLQLKIKELLNQYNIDNYFLFDMSVPDAINYHRNDFNNLYTRQSDYETLPSFYNIARGVWMDEFNKEWINKEILNDHLKNKKEIVIVSPELHKKDNYLTRWKFYKTLNCVESLAICTDYPDKAKNFFYDK